MFYRNPWEIILKAVRKNRWGLGDEQKRLQDYIWLFEWLSIVQFILNCLGGEKVVENWEQYRWFPTVARKMNFIQYRILIPTSQILIWTSLNLLFLSLIKVGETPWRGSFYICTRVMILLFTKIIIHKAYEWSLIFIWFGPSDCFEIIILYTKRLYDYLHSDEQQYKTKRRNYHWKI